MYSIYDAHRILNNNYMIYCDAHRPMQSRAFNQCSIGVGDIIWSSSFGCTPASAPYKYKPHITWSAPLIAAQITVAIVKCTAVIITCPPWPGNWSVRLRGSTNKITDNIYKWVPTKTPWKSNILYSNEIKPLNK